MLFVEKLKCFGAHFTVMEPKLLAVGKIPIDVESMSIDL
jgi:hypothetical protein